MLTAQREKFCQAIVSGCNQSDAYRAAYNTKNHKPETIHSNASRLLTDAKVIARINELKRPVVEKLQYGLEQAMLEAQDAFNVSKTKEQGGAMVAAVTLRAKLNNLLVERKEVTINSVQEMSEADLQAFIARKAKEAGIQFH